MEEAQLLRPLLHFDHGVEQACSASVGVTSPQPIRQPKPVSYEAAATPARPRAEPVSSEVPPVLTGGFRREVDENGTDVFSENLTSEVLNSCISGQVFNCATFSTSCSMALQGGYLEAWRVTCCPSHPRCTGTVRVATAARWDANVLWRRWSWLTAEKSQKEQTKAHAWLEAPGSCELRRRGCRARG